MYLNDQGRNYKGKKKEQRMKPSVLSKAAKKARKAEQNKAYRARRKARPQEIQKEFIFPAKVESNEYPTIFASGAKSSSNAKRFDLIPRVALEKLADRFELGLLKYDAFNYRKGLHDKEFIIDRLNHLQMHMQALLAPQTNEEIEDDNIGAILWAASFIAEVESQQSSKDILNLIRGERSRNLVLLPDGNFQVME